MARKAISKHKSVVPSKEGMSSDEGFADDGSSDGSAQALLNSLKVKKSSNEFDNINVVVRVKPSVPSLNGPRKVQPERDDLFPAAGQIQLVDPSSGALRSFTFDVIFEPEASQEDVFEHSRLKKFIDMSLEGFASTVFAYGQTGSGKTFTMTGNIFTDNKANGANSPSTSLNSLNEAFTSSAGGSTNSSRGGSRSTKKEHEVVGLTQFTFAYLFEQIRSRSDVTYVVTTSFLEVYNEHVYDLLNPAPKSLNVRWSKDRGFYAENLFKVECEDLSDLEGVLKEGLKNRSVRSHEMNATSSRSHSLLTINLSSETKDPEDPNGYIKREGKICLVDLAGSEKTKRTLSKGDTFIEANNINKSLLVLGNCISSLSSGKCAHIPYRDSILTKLLADSLSGSGMTLMVACVSALPQDASETINTLRYASRAKNVKTNPIVRMDPRELSILSLKREVRLLRMENNYLRQQLNLGNGSSSSPFEGQPSAVYPNHRPSITSIDPTLFQQYMRENESLRAENQTLITQRDQLIHDQEEADRTIRKLSKAYEVAAGSSNLHPVSQKITSENVEEELSKLYSKNSNKSKSSGNLNLVTSNEKGKVMKSQVPVPSKKVVKGDDTRRPSIVMGWDENNDALEVKGTTATVTMRGLGSRGVHR